MSATAPRPGRCWLALAPAALLLTGCQAVVSSQGGAAVRIVQAAPDAPGLDFYANGNVLATNIGFGSVTSYVPVTPGTYTITADTAGSTQALASAKQTFTGGTEYTVLVGEDGADYGETVLQDQSQPAPSGEIALRFIDQASVVGPLDIYLVPAGQKLTAVTPLLSGLIFQNTPAYINVPAGTYSLVIVPSGTLPTSTTVATYTGAQVGYGVGSATTYVLVNQQLITAPGVRVIPVTDYTSPTSAS